MRPLQLTMTAFGPFAATEEIDFRRLGDRPLFLINGATGAGKTTILDGICFALYGSTTGNEREASQMRCDYADDQHITRVELLFELRGRHYRIVREPEQLRPKVRGEGYTTHKPRAELFRLREDDEDGESKEEPLVAAKVSEATRTIEELTGLTVEQFRQVMVLPQGEFRRLLLAGSGERERIFSQLFQTQIYKRIEDSLKIRSGNLRQQRENLLNRQKGILETGGLDSGEALQEQLSALEPQLQQAQEQLQGVQQQLQAVQKEHDEAQQREQRYQQLLSEQKRQQILEQRRGLQEQQRQQLALAQDALRLQPDWELCQREQQQRQVLQVQLSESQQRLQQQQQQLEQARTAMQELDSLQKDIDQLKAEAQQLLGYRERVDHWEQAEQQRRQAEQHYQQQQQTVAEQQQRLNRMSQQVEQGQRQLRDLQEQLNELNPEQQRLQQLNERCQRRIQLDADNAKLAEIESNLQGLQQQRQQAEGEGKALRQARDQLELQWHRGQAALLAAQLQEGEPCPVCGSDKHPQPAYDTTAIPDQAQRQQATQALEAAREAFVEIEQRLAVQKTNREHLQQQIETHRLGLGDAVDLPLSELQQQLQRLQQRVQALEQSQQIHQSVTEQLQQWQQQLDTLRLQQERESKAQAQANTRLELANQQLQQTLTELPEAFRQAGALQRAFVDNESRLQQTTQRLQQLQKNLEQAQLAFEAARAHDQSMRQQWQQTEDACCKAQQSWLQVLQDSRFASEEEFLGARQSESQMQTWMQELQEFERQWAQVQGVLVRLEAQLQEQPQMDLPAIEERLQQCLQQFELKQQNHRGLDQRMVTLRGVEEALSKVIEETQTLEKRYAVIGTLADVAAGKTGDRINLQRFVLSVLLDDVLVVASQRLKRMSKGRFELYRQTEKGKGAGAFGLELMVEDAYNGKQRPVATLSGGESFMAALSLALGLSDVVQAYAGGIRLDTLFVDEGFGSLDPESLDLAINTLVDLQASGRMVGVISHVPELKERLNVRLDVHASRQGSTTELVLAS
ncbi:SMC family ATPase [Pseudomaricurvus alkylphenolicus]|uniref:AAA family ATPase n=1 Tax=Pseudomaricurvus alkylphenolicus TaxID=1306991 RepID=UPI0014243C93|nr:SMC family ATPase [Pseudomaricurvus alkylphenolicus]